MLLYNLKPICHTSKGHVSAAEAVGELDDLLLRKAQAVVEPQTSWAKHQPFASQAPMQCELWHIAQPQAH